LHYLIPEDEARSGLDGNSCGKMEMVEETVRKLRRCRKRNARKLLEQ
jgi:sRNA-binding protein